MATDKNIVCVGPKDFDKSLLLESILGTAPSIHSKNTDHFKRTLVEYEHFQLEEFGNNSDRQNIENFNFWFCDEKKFSEIFSHFVRTEDDTAVILLVDYLRPWDLISDAENWLLSLNNLNRKSVSIVLVVLNFDVGMEEEAKKFETALELQKRSQFILRKLRLLCLQNGAALIYTGARGHTNFGTLRTMLLKKWFPSDFSEETSAQVSGAVVIPWKWDSVQLIDSLVDNKDGNSEEDRPFDEIVERPVCDSEGGAGEQNNDNDEETLDLESDWLFELSKVGQAAPALGALHRSSSTFAMPDSQSLVKPQLVRKQSEPFQQSKKGNSESE
eukprot:CAMPEP_0171481764 /NCGR_PEP_ID=MMETSP0946-20130122/6989_1 /TAXON_ID=109269 /ORGANISM="Vaucheria litorea, Strain CCMP2940" /LENGTH=328 /DNA_ID=CAMNT_0012013497 /DNA_START=6 /DNA_END=989 /DNA_ORIENTATION=+